MPAPANSVAPAISGNQRFGQVLTTTNGTWTNSPAGYAYQWKRNGSNIASATSSTYTLVEADAGQSIACSVTASNATGSASIASNALIIDVYVVFLSAIVDATDLTTYSGGVWNAVSFGTPAANRKLIICIGSRNTAGSRTLSSASFGAVSSFTASVPPVLSDSVQNFASVVAVDNTADASGNISTTWSASMTRLGMGLYAVYGAESSIPNDYGTTSLDATAVNIFARSGSVIIAYSFTNTNTPAWTGVTQDFAGIVESTLSHSGAHASFASGVLSTTAFSVDWAGTITPSTLFAAFSPAQTATVDLSADVVVADGARTWFNTPSTILVGGDIFAGAVSTGGNIVVGKSGVSPVVLKTALQEDDHDNPGLLRRSLDGRILAAYCNHNGANNYYVHISTNPDDASAFGAASDIGSTLGTENWGYGNLVEVTDGIFNFVRGLNGATWTQGFSKSTDGGVTWSARTVWFGPGANRPYFQIVKNGANRFDIFSGDANPDEGATGIYHFYYSAGSWFKSDGTSIGSPPFTTSQFTQIWNGATVRSWAWDAKAYSGTPVIVYATFPDTLNHQYRYARWSGSAWVDNFVCNGGSTIYAAPGSEDFYSGGICLDPDDINTIYCSRRVAGVHQLFKGVTANGGATWTLTQLTFGSVKRFRPQKLSGVSAVTYLAGSYTTYTNFGTAVRKLAV